MAMMIYDACRCVSSLQQQTVDLSDLQPACKDVSSQRPLFDQMKMRPVTNFWDNVRKVNTHSVGTTRWYNRNSAAGSHDAHPESNHNKPNPYLDLTDNLYLN